MEALRSAAVAAALLIVIGCSGSANSAAYGDRSATQIADDATTSLSSAKSAHLSITSTPEGSSPAFDGDVDGGNMKGKMTQMPGTINFVVIGETIYIYGPDLLAFAHVSDPAVKARVGERWVSMPAATIMGQGNVGKMGDLGAIAQCLETGSFTKKGTSTVAGEQVVEVDDQKGDQLFVRTAAPHYPARIVFASASPCASSSGSSSTVLGLSNVGEHFDITAPPNSVDAASLGLRPGS